MANAQLELACRVGSREAIMEALEDGADIDFGGSSPLIIAILARDRPTVETLVSLGADVNCFELTTKEPEEIVDALMRIAPAPSDIPDEDPVDAKLVRAFDRMIRTKGMDEPFKKKRGGEYAGFCDGLKWIAAEECHATVTEFLGWIEPVCIGSDDGDLLAFLEENRPRLEQLRNRYTASVDLPAELLKDYLKDRKKLR